MEEDHEDEVPNVNFVPSLLFIKRGIAKANPDKVTLTPAELARIISETRDDLEEEAGSDMDASEDEENEESAATITNRAAEHLASGQTGDEYGFEQYEQESGEPVIKLGSVVVIDPEDNVQDEEDSEAEDDIIKPSDNLILVGHVQNEIASMEVYIYNEEEGSLYVHHDFLLPSPPLCIEWLNFDPGSEKTGNLCAIGCMDPVITLWDLDIQDSLEPVCKLGSKGSRKKNKPKIGHTDAVLDLSWNTNLEHILASGSVDQTVILWDIEDGTPHTTIKDFEEKVQTLSFHPTNPHSLLVGSCDGKVKVFDCRATTNDSASFQTWELEGEVERVFWNWHNKDQFVASTNDGRIHYVDVRQQHPLWSKEIHEKEVTGLLLSSRVKGMMTTASADGSLKVWDYNDEDARLVYKKNPKMGVLQCLGECPENPFIVALGGDLKTKNFSVVNLLDNENVSEAFKSRFQSAATTAEEEQDASMDEGSS